MSDKNGTKLRDERQKSTANTIRSQTFTRIHNQYRHTDTDTNTSSSIEPQLSHSQSRALFLFLRFKLLKAAAHRFLCIYIYFWNNYTNTKKFPPMLWFGFVSSFQMEQESQHGILCYHTVRLSHFRIEFWNNDRALVLFTPLICFDEKKNRTIVQNEYRAFKSIDGKVPHFQHIHLRIRYRATLNWCWK